MVSGGEPLQFVDRVGADANYLETSGNKPGVVVAEIAGLGGATGGHGCGVEVHHYLGVTVFAQGERGSVVGGECEVRRNIADSKSFCHSS